MRLLRPVKHFTSVFVESRRREPYIAGDQSPLTVVRDLL